MSQVNGVTSVDTGSLYTGIAKTKAKTETRAVKDNSADATASKSEETGVVLELSSSSGNANNAEATASKAAIDKTDRNALIEKLKSETEARTQQLRDLVTKLITGQGKTIGNADDMWKFLASGDFEVDAATKAQAQEDISEDGYWGVKATSDRIIDFAKALTGGDASKIDTMLDAFKKGFQQATSTWGKELPEISQKTYDAVLEKFQQWKNEANGDSKEVITEASTS